MKLESPHRVSPPPTVVHRSGHHPASDVESERAMNNDSRHVYIQIYFLALFLSHFADH